MKRLVMAVAMVVAVIGQANAADPPGTVKIAVRSVDVPGVPVTIESSSSFKRNDNLAIVSCLAFMNHGAQTASAIKLRFFQLDAFGDVQNYDDKQITGAFSPNVRIGVGMNIYGAPNDVDGRCWTAYLFVPQTNRLSVRVEKVLFMDGSVWTSPLYGTTTPGEGTPLRAPAPTMPLPTISPSK